MNLNRRSVLLGILGGGAVTTTLPAKWSTPLINSVLTPVHAQMSPPVVPAPALPTIMMGNVLFGPVSGTSIPPVCSITFDVLSEGENSFTVDDITNTTAADTTVSYDGSPVFNGPVTATSTAGPRVVWRGPATDAPFCSDAMPIGDVVFTVTATSSMASGSNQFSQDFTLADILA